MGRACELLRAFLSLVGIVSTLLAVSPRPSAGMGLCWGTCPPPPPPSLQVASLGRLNLGAHGPVRIAVDPQGRFYITDPQKSRVFVTDAHGNAAAPVPVEFYPAGIAVGPDGRIYVGDVISQAVYVWSPQGRFLYPLGVGEGEFGWPNDIAVDQVSGWVYVADTQGNQVKVYEPDGAYMFSITVSGTYPFNPTGVAVDPLGHKVIVSDHNNLKLQVFDTSGVWLSSIGTLVRPQGVAVDAQGRIYVADAFQSKVYVYSSAGESLGAFGQYGTEPGKLRVPTDVVVDPYGRVAVVSYNNGAVELYGPPGYIEPPAVVEPPALSNLSFTTLVEVSVDFDPGTLNLSSQGRWFRAYIKPVDAFAQSIDVASVFLNGQVPAETTGWALNDSDGDGLLELMVLFGRQKVQALIDPSATGATLVVTGGGHNFIFEGSGYIKVVNSSSEAASRSEVKKAKP